MSQRVSKCLAEINVIKTGGGVSSPFGVKMDRMKMRRWGVLALASLGLAAAADLDLELRSRVEAFKGSGDWQEVRFRKSFPVDQTAILICDMWDNHWCKGAVSRVVPLAQKMSPLIDAARARSADHPRAFGDHGFL